MKPCAVCNLPHARRAKTCSAACAAEYSRRWNRAYMQRQRGAPALDPIDADAIMRIDLTTARKLLRIAFDRDLFRFCIQCGVPFEAVDLRKCFCSRKCKDAETNLASPRYCAVCGVLVPLEHARDRRVTCSGVCEREQAARRNRRYRRSPAAIRLSREYQRKRRKTHGDKIQAYGRDYAQKKQLRKDLDDIRKSVGNAGHSEGAP